MKCMCIDNEVVAAYKIRSVTEKHTKIIVYLSNLWSVQEKKLFIYTFDSMNTFSFDPTPHVNIIKRFDYGNKIAVVVKVSTCHRCRLSH